MEQYEIKWKDYYSILGINRNAEPEVIKAAYTAMAKKYHPDNYGNLERMKEINEAYETLSNNERKVRYDILYDEKSASNDESCIYSNHYDTYTEQTCNETYDYADETHFEYTKSDEKFLPWPSRKWQIAAIIINCITALFLIIIVGKDLAPLIGYIMLASGLYACIKSKGLTHINNSKSITRIAGIFATICGLLIIAAILLGLAILLIIPAGIFLNYMEKEKNESQAKF